MPNSFDATGLQVATLTEIVANLTSAMQTIYGADINLASDSPDGQWLNIIAQAAVDLEDLLVQINSSFDPDNATGTILDQRVSINGIQRQAGTYTITPITIVNSASVNLYGLDQTAQQIYTVADSAGNNWFLQTTVLGVGAGTHVYNFRAANPGANLTIPNTITVQVTIVLGVTSVNNPTTYTTLGINEETDGALKIRRQQSVSLASQGYLSGLLAALENISGVTSAFVYENDTNTTSSDGVPGHTIWVIVAGSGAAADIAQAIYVKRNAGCGMFGSISYNVTQIDGSLFTIYWDDVVTRNLFIKFTASSINGIAAPNVGLIRTTLPITFVPGVFQEVNINGLATLVQDIDSNTLVTNAGFSSGELQTFTLSGVAASGTFGINYNGAVTSINWNDSIGTIQTKVQGITGLSAATVTGSIASQSLVFNLSLIGGVQALLYTVSNTLLTSGAVAITFAYDAAYTNTLTPLSKKYQFIVSSPNIVIVPMLLQPATAAIIHSTMLQFSAYGGYGTYTYSISVNNSGGSINSSTGLYTAGVTGSVVDTIKVVDVYGDSATSLVTVS